MVKKKIYTFESKYSDIIRVVEMNGSYSIVVNRYTESGPDIEYIWEEALSKLVQDISPTKILVLGFGAGSIMKPLKRRWSHINVTGVEIDPVMITIARKYFPHNIEGVEIIVTNALKYVKTIKASLKFDLVIVDCYIGGQEPKAIKTLAFLRSLKTIGKRVLFNQLFLPDDKRELARIDFLRDLDRMYRVRALKLPYNIIVEY